MCALNAIRCQSQQTVFMVLFLAHGRSLQQSFMLTTIFSRYKTKIHILLISVCISPLDVNWESMQISGHARYHLGLTFWKYMHSNL